MLRGTILAGITALALALTGPGAAAQSVALEDDARLTHGLMVVAVGNRIRRGCEAISPRVFRALDYIWDLVAYAESLGYTRAEVEAFRNDPAQKARIDALTDAWLAERGTTRHDAEGLCRVGAQEIAQGTEIGRLLRMN